MQNIVLVTGGRTYSNREFLFNYLDKLHAIKPISLIVHGGATGADDLAGQWAMSRGVPIWMFHITKEDWERYGNRAGKVRNRHMLQTSKPDLIVAFNGGSGTTDMIIQGRRAGVIVVTAWN